MDHLDQKMLDLTQKVNANSQLIVDERRERKERLTRLNERIDFLKRLQILAGILAVASAAPRSRFNTTRDDDDYHKYERARFFVFFPIEGETDN